MPACLGQVDSAYEQWKGLFDVFLRHFYSNLNF